MATVTKCHKCNGSGIVFVGGIRAPIDKPFHCNVCDGSFSRYSSLWSHKRLHTGDKPFKCDICGLAFARQAYLKNHGRVHSGEKPYKCNICGMLFSQSPHLKNHERIHRGERDPISVKYVRRHLPDILPCGTIGGYTRGRNLTAVQYVALPSTKQHTSRTIPR
ncbi:hypothetical protein WDU94_001076 [Cyamophila willieti]